MPTFGSSKTLQMANKWLCNGVQRIDKVGDLGNEREGVIRSAMTRGIGGPRTSIREQRGQNWVRTKRRKTHLRGEAVVGREEERYFRGHVPC